MLCPCKDCEKRVVGCHASCGDYKSWKGEQDKRREQKYKENVTVSALIDHRLKVMNKIKRSH